MVIPLGRVSMSRELFLGNCWYAKEEASALCNSALVL